MSPLKHLIYITPNIIPLPWAQLTRLSVSFDSPQSCLDIPVQCTSLVSSHFITNQWLESDSPDASTLGGTGFLAHLEELDIEMCICCTGEHLGPFLRRLRLPALKSLSLSLHVALDVEEYLISWATLALIFLLTRSPNLERLKLNYVVFAEEIPVILQLTPNVVELVFGEIEVDDNFSRPRRPPRQAPRRWCLTPDVGAYICRRRFFKGQLCSDD
ncbi:hypothetical protein B0H19DRAFT_649039 [Mycena capillaripes]|nr:hypothetical protein B0H19DRAFT_649039 [Mycena capillaripes]